jgi:hypothetical protein
MSVLFFGNQGNLSFLTAYNIIYYKICQEETYFGLYFSVFLSFKKKKHQKHICIEVCCNSRERRMFTIWLYFGYSIMKLFIFIFLKDKGLQNLKIIITFTLIAKSRHHVIQNLCTLKYIWHTFSNLIENGLTFEEIEWFYTF